jgi:hypothetical protein
MSQLTRYYLVVVLSVVCSVGGVIYGAVYDPLDGGRGGAIGVALAFYLLFVRMRLGQAAYRIVTQNNDEQGDPSENKETFESVNRRIDGVLLMLNTEEDNQHQQNKALTLASCIGTMVWGFGDWISEWLKNLLEWLRIL